MTHTTRTRLGVEQLEDRLTPTGSFLVTPGTLINTQRLPDAAVNDGGHSVVVWGVDDDDAYFVRIFNPDGTPAGAPQVVNPPGLIADNTLGGIKNRPFVGYLGDGGFVVAWRGRNTDGTDARPYLSRYSATGQLLGPPTPVTPYSTNTLALSMGTAPNGQFVVTWYGDEGNTPDDDTYGVIARVYDPSGTPRGPAFQVNPDDNTTFGDTVSAGINNNGNFTVAWVGGNDIYAKQFGPAGNAMTGSYVANSIRVGVQSEPWVAVDPAGNADVVWATEGPEVHGARFTSGGRPIGSEFTIAATEFSDEPSVAADGGGNFFVAWNQSLTVYGRQYDASGQPLSAGFALDVPAPPPLTRQLEPAVAASNNGNVLVAWHSNPESGGSQILARYNPGSETSVAISPTSLATPQVGVAYTQTLTAIGPAGPFTFAVAAGDFPPGLSLAPGGVLSGTPTAAGSYSFAVTARNGAGASGTQSYSLVVGQAGSVPRVGNNIVVLGVAGNPFSGTFRPGGTVSLTMDVVNLGTVDEPAFGVHYILSADDALDAGDPTVTLTTPADTDPVAAGSHRFTAATFQVPGLLSGTYRVGWVIDSDPDPASGQGLFAGSITINNPPPNFLGHSLTLDPPADGSGAFHPGDTVTVRLTIEYQGGGGPVTLPVGFYVAPVPAGSAPGVSTSDAGGTGTITNLTPGTSTSLTYQFTLATPYTPGDYVLGLIIDPNNTLPESNKADNGNQGVGIDLATFRVRNRVVVNTAIGLSPNPLPPATVGQPYSVNLTGTAGTGPFRVVALNPAALPPGLSVQYTHPVTLSGTPDAAGTYTFDLEVVAADGQYNVVTTSLVVDPPASPPPAVPPLFQSGSLPLVSPRLVVGGGTNSAGLVFDPTNGQFPLSPTSTASPFGNTGANVRVASGDVNGDGTADTILVTGPGTTIQVAVVSGKDGSVLVAPFNPFPTDDPNAPQFDAGGFASTGDIDGDGRQEFVITPDRRGGPRVSIYSLSPDGSVSRRANFFSVDPNFRGGARAALGDINGDGKADLALSAGFGGGPRVAIIDGTRILQTTGFEQGDRLALPGGGTINDFFAFDDAISRNGTYLAIGDVDGDGFGDLVFGIAAGESQPLVKVVSGQALIQPGGNVSAVDGPFSQFVFGDPNSRGGVRVGTLDADGDSKADVIVGSGEGQPARALVYLGTDFTAGGGEPGTFEDVNVFDGAALTDGVFVG